MLLQASDQQCGTSSYPICRGPPVLAHLLCSVGACDPATIARLKRYGDHAKAAYVLYGHFGDSGLQPAEMQSNGLRALTER